MMSVKVNHTVAVRWGYKRSVRRSSHKSITHLVRILSRFSLFLLKVLQKLFNLSQLDRQREHYDIVHRASSSVMFVSVKLVAHGLVLVIHPFPPHLRPVFILALPFRIPLGRNAGVSSFAAASLGLSYLFNQDKRQSANPQKNS